MAAPIATTRYFDLNIEGILEDWESYHALREVIANALDEQALTNTEEIKIFKDKEGLWHIRDYGRGLKYEHLTQDENEEKHLHRELVIGKFGVGLKDGLATFDRANIHVLIRSKHGEITTAKLPKHGFHDVVTLHAVVDCPSDTEFVGTEFILGSVKDEDIEIAKNLFLKFSDERVLETTKLGQVLQVDKDRKNKIYITGLRVAEEDNFLFSYNITSLTGSMRKALDRERTHVGRMAYVDRVKSILLSCNEKNVVELLVEDLEQYESGLIHDELTWTDVTVHACQKLNASKKVIFLTPKEFITAKRMVDSASDDGLKIVTVPETIRKKLACLKDGTGNPIRDLDTYATEFNTSFKFKFVDTERDLTEREKNVFSKTSDILNLINGKPSNVNKILISETMRLEKMGYQEAVGVYEPLNQRIIIKRDQLEKLQTYAGTLLHEVAHARSGAEDISREFELELSKLLGIISDEAIS